MNLNQNEREIIASFKSGNRAAFNSIYEAYWMHLYRIAFKFTRATDESEDLVQELFVELWTKRDNVDEEKSIKPYLTRALVHKALKRIRNNDASYKRDFFLRIKNQYYSNNGANPIQEAIDLDDLEAWLERELTRLPATSQIIFRLSRQDNYSNRQIAEKLNISVKTVESHLTKALSALRTGIRKKNADLIYTVLGFMFMLLN